MTNLRCISLVVTLAFLLQALPSSATHPLHHVRHHLHPLHPHLVTSKGIEAFAMEDVFKALYAFGESLTDTGNAMALGILKHGPGVSQGTSGSSPSGNHLCDGKLVVDFVCEALGIPPVPAFQNASANFTHGANFAVAGSTALPSNFFAQNDIHSWFLNTIPKSIDLQIDWFHKFLQGMAVQGTNHVVGGGKGSGSGSMSGNIGGSGDGSVSGSGKISGSADGTVGGSASGSGSGSESMSGSENGIGGSGSGSGSMTGTGSGSGKMSGSMSGSGGGSGGVSGSGGGHVSGSGSMSGSSGGSGGVSGSGGGGSHVSGSGSMSGSGGGSGGVSGSGGGHVSGSGSMRESGGGGSGSMSGTGGASVGGSGSITGSDSGSMGGKMNGSGSESGHGSGSMSGSSSASGSGSMTGKSSGSGSVNCSGSVSMEGALFWIGGIGLSDYPRLLGSSSISNQGFTQQSVSQVCKLVETLLENGAIYVVVQGLPPCGCFPASLALTPTSDRDKYGCCASANAMVTAHNEMLQKNLAELQKTYSSASIIYADFWKAYMNILENHDKYNFAEPFKACCGAGSGALNFDIHHLCGSTNTAACRDAAQHMIWDGIHLTEAMNKEVADQFLYHGCTSPPLQEVIKKKMG